MRTRIFLPAFNVGEGIKELLGEFNDAVELLSRRGHCVEVLVINDCSTDNTKAILGSSVIEYSWLKVKNNEANLGNAANIISGYKWGVELDFRGDVIGCMDADGEHSPYALIRHLKMIGTGWDGVVGSIIFPDHDCNYHDRNMMRFWGGMQAAMAGIDGMFFIQSPGYNLHKVWRVAGALNLLEEYQRFFAENTNEVFPRWGLHGVMIHLIAMGTKSRIKAAYLECFGKSPNRSPDKLLLQANAASVHATMLAKFFARK